MAIVYLVWQVEQHCKAWMKNSWSKPMSVHNLATCTLDTCTFDLIAIIIMMQSQMDTVMLRPSWQLLCQTTFTLLLSSIYYESCRNPLPPLQTFCLATVCEIMWWSLNFKGLDKKEIACSGIKLMVRQFLSSQVEIEVKSKAISFLSDGKRSEE